MDRARLMHMDEVGLAAIQPQMLMRWQRQVGTARLELQEVY